MAFLVRSDRVRTAQDSIFRTFRCTGSGTLFEPVSSEILSDMLQRVAGVAPRYASRSPAILHGENRSIKQIPAWFQHQVY
jgi:hypothetical protein